MLTALRDLKDDGIVAVDGELKLDLTWWQKYISTFNGVVMMPFQDWSQPDTVLAVDACLSGVGGICWSANEVFPQALPDWMLLANHHINELECLCLVIALKLWASKLKHKKILIFTVNNDKTQCYEFNDH
jgi:hypothetical protein